jgi:hypothetical protein
VYNRLFTKILDSSIWLEPDSTRIVWLTLIASMDEDGFCAFACAANLANRARVPTDKTQEAIKTLESPDPNSADPDHDGRRIERVPGGWIVLNAAKYREIGNRAASRETTRRRVAAFRASKHPPIAGCNGDVTPGNASVTECNPSDAVAGADVKTSSSEVKDAPDQKSESKLSPSSIEKKEPPKPSHEAEKLAALLESEIRRNKPNCRITPAQLRNWAIAADRMMRVDGRTEDRIAALIHWAQRDEFWAPNCLSMGTLRTKFDQLELKCERDLGNGKVAASGGNGPKPIPPNIRMLQALEGTE